MKRVCQLATIALALFALISPIHRAAAKERIHVVSNPRVSLHGYTIYKASEKVNDPRAQDPTFIYLIINQDAVRLTGPYLSVADAVNVNEPGLLQSPLTSGCHFERSERGVRNLVCASGLRFLAFARNDT